MINYNKLQDIKNLITKEITRNMGFLIDTYSIAKDKYSSIHNKSIIDICNKKLKQLQLPSLNEMEVNLKSKDYNVYRGKGLVLLAKETYIDHEVISDIFMNDSKVNSLIKKTREKDNKKMDIVLLSHPLASNKNNSKTIRELLLTLDIIDNAGTDTSYIISTIKKGIDEKIDSSLDTYDNVQISTDDKIVKCISINSNNQIIEAGLSRKLRDINTLYIKDFNKILNAIGKFKSYKETFTKLGKTAKYSILITGDTGSGKSSLASVILSLINPKYITQIDANSINTTTISKIVEESGEYSNEMLYSSNPNVVIIDEIDKITDEHTYSSLLQLLDGGLTTSNTFFILIGNSSNNLSEEFMRAGRIDEKIHLEYFNKSDALALLMKLNITIGNVLSLDNLRDIVDSLYKKNEEELIMPATIYNTFIDFIYTKDIGLDDKNKNIKNGLNTLINREETIKDIATDIINKNKNVTTEEIVNVLNINDTSSKEITQEDIYELTEEILEEYFNIVKRDNTIKEYEEYDCLTETDKEGIFNEGYDSGVKDME